MGDSDFNDLLQAAEQLSSEVEGTGDLPKVERSLHQVLEASTELWSKVTQDGTHDMQAQLLLSSKGVDLPQLSQKLDSLSTRKTFEPLDQISEADVQKYLKNEFENAMLSVIEEMNKSCFDDQDHDHWESMQYEWKLQKQAAMASFLSSADDTLDVTIQPEMPLIDDGISGRIRSTLDDKEMAYAKQIAQYNLAVMNGTDQPSFVENLLEVAKELGDKKAIEMWEMVKYISQLPPQACGEPHAMRTSIPVQTALISQARKYLQDRYRKYMNSVVMSNLQQAQRGGIPGTYTLVRSYVGITVPRNMPGLEDGEVDGQPIWPLIYYSLRCGDIKAAMHCSQKGQNLDEFTSVLEELYKSSDNKLSQRVEHLVRFQYKRHEKNITDPFKRAVHCVIGACDASDDHPDIIKTADDYLWVKLCQVKTEETSEPGTRTLTYSYLQTLILEEYGEAYYNASEHPHVYFQVLFLTGQFEAALEFLSRTQKHRVHAVHIAIALNEQGLLAITPKVQDPLLTADSKDKQPAKRLNIARLIMLYVSKFEGTDIREAMHYYYFLRNMSSSENENLFISCVCDLALATREFNLILGYIRPDGYRIPGLIDSFQTTQISAKAVTEMVAVDCEKKGLFEDAINLYDLSCNHEKVLSLLVRLLCQVVHQPHQPGTLRARLQDFSYSISDRYAGQEFSCSARTAASFYAMKDILGFFSSYHAQDYVKALEVIQNSKLIPLSSDEINETVLNFKQVSQDVSLIIPDVVLATMTILYKQYTKLRGDSQGISFGKYENKDKQLASLREKAHVLATFAGHIPYGFSNDTLSKVAQMEVLMN